MGDVITAAQIAAYLGANILGEDLRIDSVGPLDQFTDGMLAFSKQALMTLPNNPKGVLLCLPHAEIQSNATTLILVENPRLAFAKVLNEFFVTKAPPHIHSSVVIGSDCEIHETVSIGPNCVIGDNVTIDADTIINSGVVIADNTVIGRDCYIRSNSVIGEEGFGFDFDEEKTPVRLPHLGNVIIGNYVEIGAKTTVARATLGSTIIEDHVKIDDLVHVAHNCKIGRNTLITACAEISGSVTIGENCWLAPNCTIIQKLNIGDRATIGIGAVIIKDVKSDQKVMGLEGIDLKTLKRFKQRISFGQD